MSDVDRHSATLRVAARPGAAGAIDHLQTLEQVLAWAHAQRPAADVVDVVVQDEFTHDVIVHSGATYLVFDTT